MKLITEKIEGITIISSLPNVLDATNTMDFKEKVTNIIEKEYNVVLDMDDVRFIDSSGCGTLITCLRRVKNNGGDLKVCNVQKQVRTVFELVRMHKIIDIFNTKNEAIRSFQ